MADCLNSAKSTRCA